MIKINQIILIFLVGFQIKENTWASKLLKDNLDIDSIDQFALYDKVNVSNFPTSVVPTIHPSSIVLSHLPSLQALLQPLITPNETE